MVPIPQTARGVPGEQNAPCTLPQPFGTGLWGLDGPLRTPRKVPIEPTADAFTLLQPPEQTSYRGGAGRSQNYFLQKRRSLSPTRGDVYEKIQQSAIETQKQFFTNQKIKQEKTLSWSKELGELVSRYGTKVPTLNITGLEEIKDKRHALKFKPNLDWHRLLDENNRRGRTTQVIKKERKIKDKESEENAFRQLEQRDDVVHLNGAFVPRSNTHQSSGTWMDRFTGSLDMSPSLHDSVHAHLLSDHVPRFSTTTEMKTKQKSDNIIYAVNFLQKKADENPAYMYLEDPRDISQRLQDDACTRKTWRVLQKERMGESRVRASLDFYPSEIMEKPEPTLTYVPDPPIKTKTAFKERERQKDFEAGDRWKNSEDRIKETLDPGSMKQVLNFGYPIPPDIKSARRELVDGRAKSKKVEAVEFLEKHLIANQSSKKHKLSQLDRFWFRPQKTQMEPVPEEKEEFIPIAPAPPQEPQTARNPRTSRLIGKTEAYDDSATGMLSPKSVSKTVKRWSTLKSGFADGPRIQAIAPLPSDWLPYETFSSFELIRKHNANLKGSRKHRSPKRKADAAPVECEAEKETKSIQNSPRKEPTNITSVIKGASQDIKKNSFKLEDQDLRGDFGLQEHASKNKSFNYGEHFISNDSFGIHNSFQSEDIQRFMRPVIRSGGFQ